MTNWQPYVEEWQKKATHYSTKALLQAALTLHQIQKQRIHSQKTKLDGMMWSPKEWHK
ncbi:MAG: hypothetical protein Q4B80_05960 [Aerococcaceae bacterium]|nr:hypothetical protein [Aerococcaceae bacterium]